MAIAIGSIVNFDSTYGLGVVTENISPLGDPIWLVTTYSGEGSPIQYRAPESRLWEIGFVPWPAGYGAGDVVEVQDTGQFWGIPQGPGVRIGRGMLVYPVTATQGAIVLPCAWVQLEAGRPPILALYSELTVVRRFGAPVP